MSKLLSTSTVPLSELGRVLVRAGALGSITLLIELVWRSPFSLASMMFFVNRYLPFFDRIVSVNSFLPKYSALTYVQSILSSNPGLDSSSAYFKLKQSLGIVISELILTLRTYAVWERKRSILITLIILTVVFLVPAIVFTELASTVISHGGCRMTSASNIIFLAFCLLTIYESILAILIAIQACKHLRQTRSPWVTKLYKDGERHIYIRDHVLCLSSRTIMREYRLMSVSAGIRAVAPSRNFPSTRATMVSEEQELPVVTLTEILELEDM
ncbi:hypothetical protein GG344DRAFT_63358 [Lentinula edodes]|nr:hypothetical protein GG344DRAFT_63358 [Lentinula edodes]